MARKSSGGPNKSQAIRDYYASHPTAKPKEISAELRKVGIDVTPAFISTIKSTTMGKKKKTMKSPSVKAAGTGKPVGRPPKAAPPKASASISIDSLVKAKSLVKELGGIDNVMATLSALKRLAD